MLPYNEEEIRKVELLSFLRGENVMREMRKGIAFRCKFRGDANALYALHLFSFVNMCNRMHILFQAE